MNTQSPPPPPLARKFVTLMLGLGISVAVGLAPYLGKVNVPGFDSLLSLLPRSIEGIALPISAAIMGTISVWVQWSGYENFEYNWFKKNFQQSIVTFFVSLCCLLIIHIFVVERVYVSATDEWVSFLTGPIRPYRAPCPSGISNADCIKILTFDEGKIVGFWGDNQVKVSRVILLLAYFVTTGTFGALIGLLLLRKELRG